MHRRPTLRTIVVGVAVALGVTLAAPAQADEAPATATISGTLVGTTGHGFPTFEQVIAEDLTGEPVAYDFTAEDGTFALDVPVGTPVHVLARPLSWYEPGYYTGDGLPTTVHMENAATVESPAAIGAVELGLYPEISGKLVGDDGGYAGGIKVEVDDAATGEYVGGGFSDNDGNFTVPGRTDRPVRLKVAPLDWYVDGYYTEPGSLASSDTADGAVIVAPAAVGSITLVSRPTITGRVLSDGAPVAGEYVVATPAKDGIDGGNVSTATTAADGTYRLRNLDAGTPYIVQFRGLPTTVLPGWYAGPDHDLSRQGGGYVPVTAPASGIDASTPAPASISGVISLGVDARFDRLYVRATEVGGARPEYEPGSPVDARGRFSIPWVWPGVRYQLCFTTSGQAYGLVAGCVGQPGQPLVEDGAAIPVTAPATAVTATVLGVGPPVDSPPGLTGGSQVGRTMTIGEGGFAWVDVTYHYQWLRSGRPIAGATGRRYTPSATDVGALLSVRVASEMVGRVATSFVVTAAAPVVRGAPPVLVSRPAITGKPTVGQRLTATPGTWSLGGLTYAYQWLRDGSPIPHAAGASYTVTLGDLGRHLTVRITTARAGYTATAATSAALVPKVPAIVKLTLAHRTIGRHEHPHATVRVTAPYGLAVRGTVTLRFGNWKRTVAVVGGRTVSFTTPTWDRGTYAMYATFRPSSSAPKLATKTTRAYLTVR
ncbi:carboxypeptidase regulatory-like domain-containing protein [Cellulomonas alba]|uniref:Carboxypeptidase regulatory-like domain-containing protein n=1 Tax=Cellulomonas alba TaxID=3053467 RepID=A0ABT7SFB0_9CELL|nr:carboxypeptidase regulatory-like domain-containing protein [Cellulomonas alba]MDM7854252.1 carboxypeptidase regulatory-like domain-containing protein [Cellulomonas alba]